MAELLDIKKQIGWHTFRHTFALRAPPVTPEIAFTNDLADYSLMVELARDSTTFAAIQTTALSSVWTVRDGDMTKARSVTPDDPAMMDAAWLPKRKDTGAKPQPR